MAVQLDRRTFLTLAAAAGFATPALQSAAAAARGALEQALRSFDRLPGTVSYQITVDKPGRQAWQVSRNPTTQMFVGSAVKTFILAQYLKDLEDGRLAADARLVVDDTWRSLESSVFLELTGKTSTSAVLEAMIAHSDNTATDIAMAQVGVARVRKFIADAGLTTVQVPVSTRRLFSYLAGAAYGVDVGWRGAQMIAEGHLFGPSRSPMNTQETMKATAADMVKYYRSILSGSYLRTDAMRGEFRRISSMADGLWRVVPVHTAAYGKGGSIIWDGFNCFSLPGQMVLGGTTPVTFFFCVNWTGSLATVPVVRDRFALAVKNTLAEVAALFS